MTKREGQILGEEIAEGLAALRRSTLGLLASAISGGLDLGFSVLLAATASTLIGGDAMDPLHRFVVANAYAFGFILVILGRSELFTEQTSLAMIPVLDRRASVGMLLRLWSIVYVGNLVGAAVFAILAVAVATSLEVATSAAFAELGERFVGHPWWVMVLSAALAGWLMGLLSWLVTAAKDTVGQIIIIWLIAGAIGFTLLHHSILGFAEIVAAFIAGGDVDLVEIGRFLLFVTLGNIVGGTIFVAGLKYTHAVRGGRLSESDLSPDVDGGPPKRNGD